MDYDARMKQLGEIIRAFTHATSIKKDGPKDIGSSAWQNSQSRKANEALVASREQHLESYDQLVAQLISALRQQQEAVFTRKQEEYTHYHSILQPMTPEERKKYMSDAVMDPSVRKMLQHFA
ncbi:hypothetical protein [Numidum massiliense]|uniref:hypothetical protein n=1 Tax=Numidum massiliense TaxID=1522315 RepID=UPI0006D5AC19|nr:hypothetical protein [Numidum massiliense]